MRKWLPLVTICLGAFILLVDVTIVNVALPSMASDLDAPFSALQWVIDGYALALAALLLVAGSLGDLFGHRRLYVAGLAVFALASLGAALSPNAAVLITARAVQGVGGAAMFATSAALVAATYRGRDRGVAFGVWGAVNGAAAAAGPIVGGLLTEGFGWQAIFLVNLPIAAVAIAIAMRSLPAAGKRGTGRLDLPGAAAFTLAAGALTYALIRGGDAGWTDGLALTAFGTAAVAAVAFVVIEARSDHPMIELALLRRPVFSGLLGGALIYQAAAFSGLVYFSLWLQDVLDLSPIRGGLALMPMAGTAFVVAAAAGRHMHRFPARVPIGGGLFIIGLGCGLLALTVHTSSGQASIFAGLAVIGVGVGFTTPVLVSAAVDAVPPDRAGMAGGAVNTARQLGMTLGIALFGAVFTARLRSVTAHGGSPHAAYASGLDRISLYAAAAGLAGAIAVVALVRPPRKTAPTPADDPTPAPATR
ncbi:MFS transporter [Actinacidiphila paucisporea]|uniref:Drug resistance transporter, EmrB/QacA subfamily n=1 Tax=Actinacidiphila paucisporea TaxID=310782 RepID=A0A1M6X9A2_9ACTN|nr:MFS transporter [Actinacidiphila paucisporea]SHL02365.1 drug resistance transporter, EmrB/QacA subfamily [Actinacidiphila paucisporea]